MKIPLTKYGMPQVVVYPAAVLAAMIVFPLITAAFLPLWAVIAIEAVLAAILIWTLMFFRDPERSCPEDGSLLLAPADGRVTEVETTEETSFIGGPALRIGIFLSIFDAHINRAPCNVKIKKITYKKGKYLNAMNPKSGRLNESNELDLVRTDSPNDRLIVRQVSGAIARRIVCEAAEGQELAGGERFGMIKFGSRTELYVSARENAKCLVQIGDKVKAGLTPLVKYGVRDAKDVEIEN
ncbi:MAG: phosphatidylserine decarboxylase family protein [Sedimentisphaerales bacterium]|nr:phosphatidylserine decarboxylase family protein [Sedimentisphaerales bacterium]